MAHTPSPRLKVLLAGLVLLAALNVPASAHGTIQGMNEISGGFLHPLLTPLHLLVLLSLGLWLGQQSPLRLKVPALVFIVCTAAGLLATFSGKIAGVPPALLTGIALCGALLVAFSARLPDWAIALLFGGAALALSLDSGVDNATSKAAIAKTLSGTWISLAVWLVTIAFYVSLCPKRQWIQIGIRVAGSWMAAISLMILAFTLKK